MKGNLKRLRYIIAIIGGVEHAPPRLHNLGMLTTHPLSRTLPLSSQLPYPWMICLEICHPVSARLPSCLCTHSYAQLILAASPAPPGLLAS